MVPLLLACGGDDNVVPDASNDGTLDTAQDVNIIDAGPDIDLDAPPAREIWVASPTTLYTFDPTTRVIKRIANFDCSNEPMIDLAMNAREELFGITSESVVRIDKVTGSCTVLARGSQNLPYATGFVAAESLEAGAETWLGYDYITLDSIDPDSGALAYAGALGFNKGNFQASGDMVSLAGGKTYITAFDVNPQAGDAILEIDPNTGAALNVTGYTGVQGLLGLAQWQGFLYMFSTTGRVYLGQITDAGLSNFKLVAVSYDFGDAGSDASDASSDADAEASGPSFIPFRGAAVTTRAPIN